MKKLRILITFIIPILFLSSCMKQDIDELRADLAEQAKRIAALESWTETINGNISALQTLVEAIDIGDYVTGVSPVTQGGVQVGYTISFLHNPTITIYHGEQGQAGADGINGSNGIDGKSPVIGVAQDPAEGAASPYYWTLDKLDGAGPQWITDGQGNKVKVTGNNGKDGADGQDGKDGQDGLNGTDGKDGKDGVTPQLRINSSNEWEYSIDNGQNWTNTGIKATGEKGETGATGATGEKGDSMFKDVDVSKNDYVKIQLADDSYIEIPRYVAMAFTFDEQLSFICEETKNISYTASDAIQSIVALNVPSKWTVEINAETKTISVKAPTMDEILGDNNLAKANIVLLAGDGGERTIMRNLTASMLNGAAGNNVGDDFYENGIQVGRVWKPTGSFNNGMGDDTGLILHKDSVEEVRYSNPWSSASYPGSPLTLTDDDGMVNFNAVKDYLPHWNELDPFKWYATLGPDWYPPTETEIKSASIADIKSKRLLFIDDQNSGEGYSSSLFVLHELGQSFTKNSTFYFYHMYDYWESFSYNNLTYGNPLFGNDYCVSVAFRKF